MKERDLVGAVGSLVFAAAWLVTMSLGLFVIVTTIGSQI